MTPEAKIQNDIRTFMQAYGWKVVRMHGNAFQKGVPDLYTVHSHHGKRWVEVKKPKGYVFTNEQLIHFPDFTAHNDGIWILNAGTREQYDLLFGPPNWESYLKPRDRKRMAELNER